MTLQGLIPLAYKTLAHCARVEAALLSEAKAREFT